MLVRIVFYLLIPLIMSIESQASINDIKIAIVDVQVIMDRSTAVSSIRANVDKLNQSLQDEFSLKEQELKIMESAIIEKKSTMSQDEFEHELIEFEKKVSNSQKTIHNKKIILEQAHARAMSEVNDVAMQIVSDIAFENKYYLVLPSNQALYINEKLDITEEVLSRLNKKLLTVDINL